eukprot:TRINITY_DN7369_c0_g1_i3.p1 TRINITY_DN7369_c0_g1~~TRINITY_DN7369_c0_g1_i3.p1  ORF type:complete len:666 (+),score=130.24 TRINITY_DN7369_c0_g1_i3:351-2348(+)
MTTVTVAYEGKRHEFVVDLDSELDIFLYQLLSVFDLEIEEQQIEGIDMSQVDYSLAQCGIKPNGVYTLKKRTKVQAPPTPVVSQQQRQQQQQHLITPQAKQFQQRLASNLQTVGAWEDAKSQQLARSLIPLELLKERARKNPSALPDSKDELFVQLLGWYKNEFFTWVNQCPCGHCNGATDNAGATHPDQTERSFGAGIVELYKCRTCPGQPITRFPRYNHPAKLLETRRGRCGEWANAFGLLARSIGFEVRHVADWTDHVWTEVYSEALGRWVHADSCENKWDTPLMYEAGWGKKLTYVIAFSVHSTVDVTRRYTRNLQEVLQRRSLVDEEWLKSQLAMITQSRFSTVSDEIMFLTLHRLDEEEKELSIAQSQSLNPNMLSVEEKEGRISGSTEWKTQRGEMGENLPENEPKVTTKKFIPAKQRMVSDTINFPALQKKLVSINDGLGDDVKLNSDELNIIFSLETELTKPNEFPHRGVTVIEKILSKWTAENAFPAIDLLKMILLHPLASEQALASSFGSNIWESVLKFLSSSNPSTVLVSVRFFLNATSNVKIAPSLKPYVLEIVETATPFCLAQTNVAFVKTLSYLLLNLSIAFPSNTFLFEALPKVIESTEDSTSLLNLALALGTILSASPAQRERKEVKAALEKLSRNSTEAIQDVFVEI